MSLYENTELAQRERHDIQPGWYAVYNIRATVNRAGTSIAFLSISTLGNHVPAVDRCPLRWPVAVVEHDPLVDAIWNLDDEPIDTGTRGLYATPVWMVELGPGGKVVGFTRATAVRGLSGWSSNCHLLAQEWADDNAYQAEARARR